MIDYFKKNHLSLLIILALVFLGPGKAAFGAVTARTTITNPWTFSEAVTLSKDLTGATTTVEKLTVGGFNVASSTTATTGTLSQNDVSAGCYVFTPNTGATTLTLPASSTLTTFIPNAGDRSTLCFRNATTTTNGAGTVTFAGGVGTILENASSTSITSVVTGGKGAYFTFLRSATSSSDVYVTMGATQ